jgi:hypothetical protein
MLGKPGLSPGPSQRQIRAQTAVDLTIARHPVRMLTITSSSLVRGAYHTVFIGNRSSFHSGSKNWLRTKQ